jgi:hypothetical protein
MRPPESGGRSSRSSGGSQGDRTRGPRYVICLENTGYPASLERLKLYRVLEPEPLDPTSLIRVVGESGEDYLYPRRFFASRTLRESGRRAVDASTRSWRRSHSAKYVLTRRERRERSTSPPPPAAPGARSNFHAGAPRTPAPS